MPGKVMTFKVRSGKVKTGPDRACKVRSQVWLDQVKSGQAKSDQNGLGLVGPGQVRSVLFDLRTH